MDYEKFSLKPEPACPWLFAVYQEVERTNKKTKEKYLVQDAIAYGVQFKKGLEIIATLAADKSSIQKYIEDYGRILDEFNAK
jgi:predicted Co/Zn/Cd cation transporter (cation efflux family)